MTEDDLQTDAQGVINEVAAMIAAGQGDATLLDNDAVNAFNGLLLHDGWTPAKVGKGVDWTKDGWTLFLRGQGPSAHTIVQWSTR